ncbi:MAG: c-type cytochrome [Gammaproteobacteria bacterium]|nr:c-type cytochrome [Gammaproteobacteria bacterium]
MNCKTFILALTLLSPLCLFADEKSAEFDADNGEDINELCAGCHGEFAQGGSDGEYPRLAGMPAAFIIRQMHLFRDRIRTNLAMVEYVDHRQMPDQDIIDVAHFISGIELPTRLPPLVEGVPFDALERLNLTRKLLNIPRLEGNSSAGLQSYNKECRSCHGDAGKGNHEKGVPLLAGQHTSYLQRTIEKYRNKQRIHDPEAPDENYFQSFTSEELNDIFAYLSIADD